MVATDNGDDVPMAVASLPRPSLPWRAYSSMLMGATNIITRAFLLAFNDLEVNGGDKFQQLLDRRKDVQGRTKGLITISNHISVLDDPFIWGALPVRYGFNPDNHRWSLGSYDLCFTNKALSTFFFGGQVLPTHRLLHSPHGGLFQPTMTQAIRLLSAQPFAATPTTPAPTRPSMKLTSPDIGDPFSSNILTFPNALTYTTNGVDTFPAPSAYENRKHAWVHIFPEGRVHQHKLKTQRYFRWGVSRLILEAEPLPDIVPMYIDGMQEIMHESREFPRFLPRIGKKVQITFGDPVDGEAVFGDLRRRWKELVAKEREFFHKRGIPDKLSMGELSENLKHGEEAIKLRIETTKRVREEVLKVRRSLGLADEDPSQALVETWKDEDSWRLKS